jgi:hypothetical protein
MLIFNFVSVDEIIKFLTETFHPIYYSVNVFINLILNKGLASARQQFPEATNLRSNLQTWHAQDISSWLEHNSDHIFLFPLVFTFNAETEVLILQLHAKKCVSNQTISKGKLSAYLQGYNRSSLKGETVLCYPYKPAL